MQYEVPNDKLELAFDNDEPLQKLLIIQQEAEDSWAKKMKAREDTVLKLKSELEVEVPMARKLASEVKMKRHRVKLLSKKKYPPSLANLKKRIVRRKATVRDQMLRQYLSTQKEDFLLRWKEEHGDKNEVSKKT